MGPVMDARSRMKWMLANAIERYCLLEAENEELKERIAQLEQQTADDQGELS